MHIQVNIVEFNYNRKGGLCLEELLSTNNLKILGSIVTLLIINTGISKFYFDKKIEKMKTDLQIHFTTEQERLNQKRNVYATLISSMAIFLNNRVDQNSEAQYKQTFLHAYDAAWLWANDEVLTALSAFLQYNMNKNLGNEWNVDIEKELFAKCILEMRKDIGFKKTKLKSGEYKFINF